LSSELVEEIYQIQAALLDSERKYRDLSINDISAFVLAKHLGIILITSDMPLRKFAEKQNVEVHGTLWVLDKLVEEYKLIAPNHGANALIKILKSKSRLPQDECEDRILKWQK